MSWNGVVSVFDPMVWSAVLISLTLLSAALFFIHKIYRYSLFTLVSSKDVWILEA